VNLLNETKNAIEESGHTPADIIFIGSKESGHCCTWDQFQTLADVEYYNGFGSQKVAEDLIIAFSDGSTLWRKEYDGSECWEFSQPFQMPPETKPISRLVVPTDRTGWESLAEINA